jgi:hypothetical protein
VRVDFTRRCAIENKTMRVESTRMRVESTRMRVESTRMRVESTCMRVESTRIRVDKKNNNKKLNMGLVPVGLRFMCIMMSLK